MCLSRSNLRDLLLRSKRILVDLTAVAVVRGEKDDRFIVHKVKRYKCGYLGVIYARSERLYTVSGTTSERHAHTAQTTLACQLWLYSLS